VCTGSMQEDMSGEFMGEWLWVDRNTEQEVSQLRRSRDPRDRRCDVLASCGMVVIEADSASAAMSKVHTADLVWDGVGVFTKGGIHDWR